MALILLSSSQECGKPERPQGAANIHIRSLNAFFRWAGHPPIRKLKEEQVIPPTFNPADVQKLIRYKPSSRERRTFTLVMLLLDTGVRINEALSLQKADMDFDNLLFRVNGKGRKERLVPFGMELRKHLWKHLATNPHGFVFCSRDGKKLMCRNVMRAVKAHCLKAFCCIWIRSSVVRFVPRR